MPDALLRYESFRECYWVDPAGECATAPWRTLAFADRLLAAAEAELRKPAPDLRWLSIFARAAERLNLPHVASPDDVRALGAVWRAPDSGEAGLSAVRADCIRRDVAEHDVWKWRLTLEVMRPSREHPLAEDFVRDCCELTGVEPKALRDLLGGVARLNARGEDGASVVRHALRQQEAVDVDTTTRALAGARESFHKEVTSHWIAAGGAIMTTHCRAAWARFMEEQGPNLKRLFPAALGGVAAIDVDRERPWVDGLAAAHFDIAERGGAKFADRARMDRLVERFQDLCLRILGHAERLSAQHQRRVERPEVRACCDAVREILGDGANRRSLLDFALVCVGAAEPPKALRFEHEGFTEHDVLRDPWLLRYLDPAELRRGDGHKLRFHLEGVRDPLRAAAAAMAAPRLDAPPASVSALVAAIESGALRLPLVPLAPALEPAAQARLHKRRLQDVDALDRLVDALEGARHHLAELGRAEAVAWRAAVDDARARLRSSGEERALPNDLTLFRHWLERAVRDAEGVRGDTVKALAARASARDEAVAAAVDDALQKQRYAEALRLLGDRPHAPEHEPARAVVWRWDAVRQYPDPRAALRRAQGHDEFVRLWLDGIQSNSNQKLRRLFRDSMLRDMSVAADTHELKVPCASIRQWFARKGQNPTALPQVTGAANLVVLTPREPPSHQNFVRLLADRVSEFACELVAVLVPRITADVRARALTEFRNRRFKAAIVDDVDVCRLLNPGGEQPLPLVALLEVILEQQRWSDVSPFSLSDGQSVQMEMYFGRADEARRLSREKGISRLFSGRKLGKSALLRFVEHTEDGQQLPSGNTLRVLYVSAAGIDGERAMVDAILEALRLRCGFVAEPGPPAEPPTTRLEGALKRYLDERPTESLLFFLDEADVFVEHQLRDYADRMEMTLSFVMRSRLEGSLDAASLPRVRFVFTGYRVTNTSRGAWGNWGDVLCLRPLDPAAAADLITRPFARLGIDVSAQARSIAHRCGCQPAVLLRFGQQLLARMEEAFPQHRRDVPVVVSPRVVSEVFDGDSVRTEIVQVTRNNFQGNEAGEIVHGVVLLEFLGVPPGALLEDAKGAVLARLEHLSDGDLQWFIPEGSSSTPEAEVNHHIQDLVARQLLVRHTEGATERHALRFPHLLPVLLQLAEEQQIRKHIDLRRKGAHASAVTVAVEGALPERDVEEIRTFLNATGREIRVVPVVASHWSDPLVDHRVGLADRLGFSPRDVFDCRAPEAPPAARLGAHAFALRAEPATAAELIRARLDGGVVFVGGADLLRWSVTETPKRGAVPDHVLTEPFSDGRWTRGRVRWWFQRVRTLEFEPADALDQLYQCTSGVPLLLGRFDAVLRRDMNLHDGETLTAADWGRAVEAFDAALPGLAGALVKGPPDVRLTAREFELLRMLVTVKSSEGDLAEHLTDLWEYYQTDLAPVGPDEWASIGILQRLGLVPVEPRAGTPRERLREVEPADAIRRVLAALPS